MPLSLSLFAGVDLSSLVDVCARGIVDISRSVASRSVGDIIGFEGVCLGASAGDVHSHREKKLRGCVDGGD